MKIFIPVIWSIIFVCCYINLDILLFHSTWNEQNLVINAIGIILNVAILITASAIGIIKLRNKQ